MSATANRPTVAIQAENSMANDMAAELQKLVSPEKALYLLCNLVDRNPSLWLDLDRILHPQNQSTSTNSTKRTAPDAFEGAVALSASSVLRSLRSLQLSELPLDTLGIVTSFLPLRGCLRWGETSSFFNELVPRYIDSISLETELSRPIYNLLSKVEHLRFLSIIGSARRTKESPPFAIPFNKMKSVQELHFKNVHFHSSLQEKHRFAGGTFSARELVLNRCSNLNVAEWLQFTANSHSPDLSTLRVVVAGDVTPDHRFRPRNDEHSLSAFALALVSSADHHQIRSLALSIGRRCILSAMRTNPLFMGTLRKLELGLVDRRCSALDSVGSGMSAIFRRLFSPRNGSAFDALEMLLIDFCPSAHSADFNDVTPSDLSDFSASIPTVFPALKLLALYGSQSELLFGDDHLRGLLDGHRLGQIIDLSLGFEQLSPSLFAGGAVIGRILTTFPNVAWLTLEHEQLLSDDADTFHSVVAATVCREQHTLRWVTLCASDKDEIYSLGNGLFVEYWDRGISHCQFEAALKRSERIVAEKQAEREQRRRRSDGLTHCQRDCALPIGGEHSDDDDDGDCEMSGAGN